MVSRQELLRGIPKVDEVLAHPGLETLAHVDAARAVREALNALREEILGGACIALPDAETLVSQILVRAANNTRPSLRRIINATGIILHTNLGRAPLAEAAAKAVQDAAAGYSTLEYEVESGGRGSRQSHVAALLTELTGAEDAIVVNNNAAAVTLALRALCSGREVVVSRGELVEIGGAFRIPEVMEQSGCILREVGATNRTRVSDYERAIRPETGALLKAHTSNFKIVGFTEEVSLPDLVDLGRKTDLPIMYDLGSGSLIPLEPYGILGEPPVPRCMAEGVDVLTFSGDKLLGGPQAGIILGKAPLIARMKSHPLARAVRIDKLTLAALEATLRLYRDPGSAVRQIPTLRMLAEPEQSLRQRADALAALLGDVGTQVTVIAAEGQVGGGSVPTQTLPSAAIAVLPNGYSVDELEQKLRACPLPIIGRIARDRLLLDVRTIETSDYEYIAATLRRLLGGDRV